jgi:hypothetical protein
MLMHTDKIRFTMIDLLDLYPRISAFICGNKVKVIQ